MRSRNPSFETIYIILVVAVLIFGIGSIAYAFNKCGFAKTMIYGKGAFWAATLGYCDE